MKITDSSVCNLFRNKKMNMMNQEIYISFIQFNQNKIMKDRILAVLCYLIEKLTHL